MDLGSSWGFWDSPFSCFPSTPLATLSLSWFCLLHIPWSHPFVSTPLHRKWNLPGPATIILILTSQQSANWLPPSTPASPGQPVLL